MKFLSIYSLLIILCTSSLMAQTDLDVFVMDVSTRGSDFNISNFRNISNTKGYDSQPSFVSDTKLIYAGTENGQTEIQLYDIEKEWKQRLNISTSGGEYSPQKFPVRDEVAAVRLDTNGLQRLYAYPYAVPPKDEPTLLLPDTEVAYFAFHDDERIIASVLGGDQLNLVIANLKTKEVSQYIENAGRSIHKVPESNSVSYTLSNEDKNKDIYILDIDEDGESFFVCQLPVGVEDHCWLNSSQLLLGSGSKLYQYDLFDASQEWKEVADLSSYNISEINRITVSPNGKKVALVATQTKKDPGAIVSAHIEPFNNRDLDGFVAAFSEDVIVRNFPNEIQSQGNDKLRKGYEAYYKRVKESSVAIENRISYKTFIIDKEVATVDGKKHHQATIYTTRDEKISSMTFIRNKKTIASPISIVDKQLEAYNNRDINAFAATYSTNVSLYNFPHKLSSSGNDALKKGYAAFFKNTPDLHCEIVNRIVIGNKVIDHEMVVMNGQKIEAVAIYEIENGKITEVTFL